MAPVWDELFLKVADKVNVARVDCTDELGRPLCKHYSIHGYPTLLFFSLETIKEKKYEGNRNLEALESWTMEQIHETKEHPDDTIALPIDGTAEVHEVKLTYMEENFPFVNAALISLKMTYLQ